MTIVVSYVVRVLVLLLCTQLNYYYDASLTPKLRGHACTFSSVWNNQYKWVTQRRW